MRDITRWGDGKRELSVNLQMDFDSEEFTIAQVVLYVASEVTFRVLAVLFLHRKITSANSQIGRLRMSWKHQESGIEGGYHAVNHCRSMMQLTFAEDKFLGEIFSPDRLRELEPDLRAGGQSGG